MGPVDFEFNTSNSGGTTEYRSAPSGLGVFNNTGRLLDGSLVELGFGVGAGFVRSGSRDRLDFDMPDCDPVPGSVAFPVLVQEDDMLRWSGATVGLAQLRGTFAVDLPGGLDG